METRNQYFTLWKLTNNITITSFKTFKRNRDHSSRNEDIPTNNWLYSDPFNDFRNPPDMSSLWIRFTSNFYIAELAA
ncbi:8285_t:CDS:2 [Rhizophagus irregularis]|nr:8285_t:CDS:2 [Rhizophagus irregularis]